MRRPVTAPIVQEFMRMLGARVRGESRVYLTGGASLLLLGLRELAIDIDVISDDDSVLRAAAELRDELAVNVDHEQPRFAPGGWEKRSPFISREGTVSFHHLDWYSQALARLERGHVKDLADLEMMLRHALVARQALLAFLSQVTMDRPTFRRAVESLQ